MRQDSASNDFPLTGRGRANQQCAFFLEQITLAQRQVPDLDEKRGRQSGQFRSSRISTARMTWIALSGEATR
jgi:hypothetical protein